MESARVLIIDGDGEVATPLSRALTAHGYEPHEANTVKDGLARFKQIRPAAVVVRLIMLPDGGAEIARNVRDYSDAPILFVSDQAERMTGQQALAIGDDYMPKPWNFDRLVGRITALVKRYEKNRPDVVFYDDGTLRLDVSARTVALAGQPLALTDTEFRLLSYLVRKADTVLSYEELARHVWGGSDLRVKPHLSRYMSVLRRLIEADPASPTYLLTARGAGYWFRPRQDAVMR